MLDPPEKVEPARRSRAGRAARRHGASTSATTSSSTRAAWASSRGHGCIGPGRNSRAARDHRRVHRLMTAFPLARSVTPVEGGTDGKFAQKVSRPARESWAESDLKGLFDDRQARARTSTRATRPGRSRIAAAVSAPAADAPPRRRPPPAAADPGGPEAGDARRRRRRQRLRHRTRAISIPGNGDLFLNIVELAGAAGKSDRHPAAGSRDRRIDMTPEQASGRAGSRWRHSRSAVRQRRPGVVEETVRALKSRRRRIRGKG